MRDLNRELRAARSLRSWLRRAALAAIPIAGLSGCGGSDCNLPDSDVFAAVDGGVPWAVGSEHSSGQCTPYCGSGTRDVCYQIDMTGCRVATATTVACHQHWAYCAKSPCGRLPPGLLGSRAATQPSLVASQLAEAAWLEGAAVLAFRTVERELIAHGAPVALIERARFAQLDEKRHHAAMSGLASRFGAHLSPIEVKDAGVQPLIEVALENAVEGCVRETWGAAVAAFQGECAGDRAVRRAMRSIARDEAEHASLGWAIDAWARERLDAPERERVETARRDALDALYALAREPVAPELSMVLGVPDPAASALMLSALAPLWRREAAA